MPPPRPPAPPRWPPAREQGSRASTASSSAEQWRGAAVASGGKWPRGQQQASEAPAAKGPLKRRASTTLEPSAARRRERAAPTETATAAAGVSPPAAAAGAGGDCVLQDTRQTRLAADVASYLDAPPPMPDAAAVKAVLKSSLVHNNVTGSWDMQELIARFLAEQSINDLEQFDLPRAFVHGGVRGRPQQGERLATDMPERWSEDVARRLGIHTCKFWLRLFAAHAPHLLEEAELRGLDCGVMGKPLPHDSFFDYSIREERDRYLELFYFTRDPRNLKALDFNPCKYSIVVDGHEIQVQYRSSSIHVYPSVQHKACTRP